MTGSAAAVPQPAQVPAARPNFRRDSEELPVYRPLALFAILGFGLAVVYAAVLSVCALAGWYSGMPLPPVAWTLLVPFLALLVSAVGWFQIQRSEGTLAGARLALWGMGISLFAGLSYGAYFGASYVAVGQQAESFATAWVMELRKGNVDEAFRLTVDPTERPRAGADLHRELELRFNTGRDGSFGGGYDMFAGGELARGLNHGRTAQTGEETRIESRGIKNFEVRGGSYHVQLTYLISSPDQTAELQVGLQGTDSSKERGRQWNVIINETGLVPASVTGLPRGARLQELKVLSSTFVGQWLMKLSENHLTDAYLDTQPPARRPALSAEYRARLLLAPGPVPAELLLPGFQDFSRGSLVRAVPDFWAPGDIKQQVLPAAQKWFEQPQALPSAWNMQTVRSLQWEQQGDRLRLYHPFQGNIFHQYIVKADIVTETDARALDDPAPPTWTIAAIELRAGRTMPQMGMPGMRPSGPR
jgi:hypothetical protein